MTYSDHVSESEQEVFWSFYLGEGACFRVLYVKVGKKKEVAVALCLPVTNVDAATGPWGPRSCLCSPGFLS